MSLAAWFWRHPRSVLLAFFLAMVAALIGLPQAKVLLTVDDLEDPDFPSLAISERIQKEFKIGHVAALVLRPHATATADWCAVKRWIEHEALTNRELIHIQSPFDLPGSAQAEDGTAKLIDLGNCQVEETRTSMPIGTAFAGSPFELVATGTDRQDLLFTFHFRDSVEPTPFGKFDPSPVHGLLMRGKLVAERAGFELHSTGPAVFRWHLLDGFRWDAWLNALALLVMAVGFWLLFGSWRGAMLLAAQMGVTGLLLFGLMTWCGVPLDILANSLGIIVAVAALQDFIFLSSLRQQGMAWDETFRKLLVPGFITSLTTVVGFGSLLAADYGPIQRFGLWAALGALIEWSVTFLLLPCLLKIMPSWRDWTHSEQTQVSQMLARLSMLRPRRWLGFSLLLLLLAFPFAPRALTIGDAPTSYFSSDHPYNQTDRYLKQSRGWDAGVYLEVAPDADAFEFASGLNDLPEVRSVVAGGAVVDWIAPAGDDPRERRVRRELLASDWATLFFHADGRQLIQLFLYDSGVTAMGKLSAAVEQLCPSEECQLGDTLVSFAEMSLALIPTLLRSFVLSVVGVILVLLVFGRLWNGRWPWRLTICSVWGGAMIIVLMAWLKIDVNYVTAVCAAVLVGVTGDNGIHYVAAGAGRGSESGAAARGLASLQIAILAAAVALCLCASSFAAARSLGLLFALGFFLTIVGDLFLFRSLGRVNGVVGDLPPQG